MLLIISLMIAILLVSCTILYRTVGKTLLNTPAGEVIDNFNGVDIFYNGFIISKSHGRNTVDGYNLGQKYQCVEFIKRYYYEIYNHKMPDTYGHAVSFYNKNLQNGQFNVERGLYQYTSPGTYKPLVGDIVVIGGIYGHVAIVSAVYDNNIEIVQQNVWKKTRDNIEFEFIDNLWVLNNPKVLGFLSLNKPIKTNEERY